MNRMSCSLMPDTLPNLIFHQSLNSQCYVLNSPINCLLNSFNKVLNSNFYNDIYGYYVGNKII